MHVHIPPSGPAALRVALVTETFPPEVNGVAMTLGRIVDGLLVRGHSVQVVRPRQANEGATRSHHALQELLCAGMPLPTYGELRFGLPSKARLLRQWTQARPHVVHVATEGPLGWSAVAAARQLAIPMTSSFHTNFHSYSKYYGIGFIQRLVEGYLRRLHNQTSVTLVPTRALATELQGQGYSNVRVLSRGVETGHFSPTRRSQELRRSWGLGDDDLAVLLVGRLAKEKNVALVLNAFRAIQQYLPTARLVLVGDGPLRRALESECPQAHFAGTRRGDDLARHYASADLFLFPSLTETFGNVVPEALASGLAVLSYANAAALELIEPGRNGLLVAPGDEAAFIRAAVDLSLHGPLQTALRHAAPASVAHLAWDAIYDGFADQLRLAVEAQPLGAGSLRPAPLGVTRSNA